MIIDPRNSNPIYRQIVEQTRDAIDAGVYRVGEALPSQRALAIEIRVNPNTIQKAYDELERLGVVEARRGLGVFVRDRKSNAARGKTEKLMDAAFRDGIVEGLANDVSPTRIRELFESSMNSSLSKARKRQ
ncbi:MAG: GntR family transcriptional regulator [Planctomycetes bacterium]|nr:GntR family transcriptional regulator [Planctomycetota bacterium]MBL7038950.1 GntR family transcriptional regulator [Pirellulaceae bacterium]